MESYLDCKWAIPNIVAFYASGIAEQEPNIILKKLDTAKSIGTREKKRQVQEFSRSQKCVFTTATYKTGYSKSWMTARKRSIILTFEGVYRVFLVYSAVDID